LRIEQEAPDSPEALATLPQLHVADIGPARVHPQPFDDSAAPLPCIAHELDTHRIDYLYCYFSLDGLDWDELPYVPLMALLFGDLGTTQHDASALATAIDLNLGSLDFFCEAHRRQGTEDMSTWLVVAASALSSKIEALASLPREVWSQTVFADRERVAATLAQHRLAMEQSMASSGHLWALGRAASYTSYTGLVNEQLSGVNFYRFLRDLVDNLDERFDALVAKLDELRQRIFVADRATVSFTGSAEDRARFWDAAGDLGLPATGGPSRLIVPKPQVLSEAFVVPANGCFVAQACEGHPLVPRNSGPWVVAARALSLDYLWNEVRVKGGAYGCGFTCTINGRLGFYSFRDPAIDPTLSRFAASADWLAAWNPTVDELEGYIVSSVAKMDAPMKPRMLARTQDTRRISGVTEELRTTIRNELLGCTAEETRALAEALRGRMGAMSTCVFGGKDQIAASAADLNVVKLLES